MATYLGGIQVDRAQAALERHAVSSTDGLCLACRVAGPCVAYGMAIRAFAEALRLPTRVPGVTRPYLIGVHRPDRRSWFQQAG